jgi:uncharacterized cupin superfamily protein
MSDDDHPTSRNAEGIYEPFRANEVPWAESFTGKRFGVRLQGLGHYGGGTKVGVEIVELLPGRQAYPAHYHMLEEEHVFVLEGSATLRLGDREYEMKAGDYVCFPAGQKAGHAMVNRTDAPCRYLVIGDREKAEVVHYTDSDRVGVRLMGEGYSKFAVMEYWDGEEIG